jgi:hypothetical protein
MGWDDVTLTVELGLASETNTYGIWDVSLWDVALWGSGFVFTDVSEFVRSLRTERQFSRGIHSWREGTVSLVLDNQDGRFSPANLDGPYVGAGETQIRPLLPIRISASYAGGSYPVWTGYIQSWTDSWSGGAPGEGDAITTLTASDEWSDLAAVDGIEVTPVGAGETTGARVHRILDAAGSTAPRDIDPGLHTVQETDLSGSVISELEKTVEAEGGALWIEADGTITYASRVGLVENVRSVTSQADFTDDGTDLSYVTAEVAYNGDLVVNYASYTREGGTPQVALATESRALYRDRRDVRTGLICETDSQALSLAQWTVQQYRDPELRFTRITVRPRRDPVNLWPVVLGLKVRDMVRVTRTPPGGFEISQLCHVAGIAHNVTPAGWETTFDLWGADLYAGLSTSRWDVGLWDAALWSF